MENNRFRKYRCLLACLLIVTGCVAQNTQKNQHRIEKLLKVNLSNYSNSVNVEIRGLNPAYSDSFAYLCLPLKQQRYFDLVRALDMKPAADGGFPNGVKWFNSSFWNMINASDTSIPDWWNPNLVEPLPVTTFAKKGDDWYWLAKYEEDKAYIVIYGILPNP